MEQISKAKKWSWVQTGLLCEHCWEGKYVYLYSPKQETLIARKCNKCGKLEAIK